MADESEARHVGHRVNAEIATLKYIRGFLIQRGHRLHCRVNPCRFGLPLFYSRRDHSRTQRLGEDQRVTWLSAAIGKNFFRMDQPSHRVSELGLIIANAVAADHGASRFDHLRESASQDTLQNPEVRL